MWPSQPELHAVLGNWKCTKTSVQSHTFLLSLSKAEYPCLSKYCSPKPLINPFSFTGILFDYRHTWKLATQLPFCWAWAKLSSPCCQGTVAQRTRSHADLWSSPPETHTIQILCNTWWLSYHTNYKILSVLVIKIMSYWSHANLTYYQPQAPILPLLISVSYTCPLIYR